MPQYQCNVCREELESNLTPFKCASCGAIAKGFTKREAFAPRSSPAPAGTGEIPAAKSTIAKPESGRVLVSFRPDRFEKDHSGARSTPAITSSGMIVAVQNDTVIAVRQSKDGFIEAWKYKTGGFIPGSPVVGSDGGIRVHSGDGFLHILAEDGKSKVQPVPVGQPLGWADPVVDKKNQTLVNHRDGGLIRVGPNGELPQRPYLRTSRRFDCTGVILDDTYYVADEDNRVHAIDILGDKGKDLWSDDLEKGKTDWYVNLAIQLTPSKTILAVCRKNRLYQFKIDGVLANSITIDGCALARPTLCDNGDCLVPISQTGNNVGNLSCIRLDTGLVVWSYSTASVIESVSVVSSDGVIYFGDGSGCLHAVSRDGKPLWTEDLDAPIRSGLLCVNDHTLAVLLNDANLCFIDVGSKN